MKTVSLLHIIFIVLLSYEKSFSAPGTADSVAPVYNSEGTLKYYLALGDSYTIGQSVPKNDRFPVQTVSLLRTAGYQVADAEIIATTGWTTANLQQAINETVFTHPYDMVSILIGVNDQYRGLQVPAYRQQFIALLKQAIQLAGNRPSHVFVLSIPDYSVTPFATHADRQHIARGINTYNAVNSQAAKLYHVHYLNITPESRKAAKDPSLVAYDGLHFSGREYKIWSALLTQQMLNAINETPLSQRLTIK